MGMKNLYLFGYKEFEQCIKLLLMAWWVFRSTVSRAPCV